MRLFKQILILILLIIFFSCSQDENVILVIDGEKISKTEFYNWMDSSSFIHSDYIQRNTILNEFAGKYLLYKEAKEKKIDQEKNFFRHISIIQNDRIIRFVMDHYIVPPLLSDSIIHKINKDTERRVHVREIRIKHKFSAVNPMDRSPQEAKKIADRIKHRLNREDINFDEAVSIYTDDQNMEFRKGSLGEISYGHISKEYSDSVWANSMNTIVGPIETKYGFHIIKVGKSDILKVRKKRNIAQEIKKGKYRILENQMDYFSEELFLQYNVKIDTNAIEQLWGEVTKNYDVLKKAISLDELNTIPFETPLAYIKNKPLKLEWFAKNYSAQPGITASRFKIPFSLLVTLRDILNRYLTEKWIWNTTKIDASMLHDRLTLDYKKQLYQYYLHLLMEKNSGLTEAIILNRIFMENSNNVVINQRVIKSIN